MWLGRARGQAGCSAGEDPPTEAQMMGFQSRGVGGGLCLLQNVQAEELDRPRDLPFHHKCSLPSLEVGDPGSLATEAVKRKPMMSRSQSLKP